MGEKITIYHGSEYIINKPELKIGKLDNDYGQGFYCTDDPEKGKEWACKNNKNGFLNEYELDVSNLKILNLFGEKYSILNWIALLLKNRRFLIDNPISIMAKEYILDNFLIDTSEYDVIIGHRADDSYFSFASGFISSNLSLNSLNKALRLGHLGTQIVLVSEKAFNYITFKKSFNVEKTVYYPKYYERDITARKEYSNSLKNSKNTLNDLFIIDIMRGDVKNDDTRIQRIISERCNE